jgi:hypothetical protein
MMAEAMHILCALHWTEGATSSFGTSSHSQGDRASSPPKSNREECWHSMRMSHQLVGVVAMPGVSQDALARNSATGTPCDGLERGERCCGVGYVRLKCASVPHKYRPWDVRDARARNYTTKPPCQRLLALSTETRCGWLVDPRGSLAR